MRLRIIWSFIFCCLLTIATPVSSATLPPSTNKIIPVGDIYEKIANLKIKDIQKITGRKLTLKEKIAVFILKQKLRHKPKESSSAGKTALTFGIIGLVSLLLFPVGFFGLLPAFVFGLAAVILGKKAKKEKPGDKKAKTAITLGWITLGTITTAAIFIIAFLLSISGGEK